MVKLTQTICRQQLKQFVGKQCLNVLDHFVGLALKELTFYWNITYDLRYEKS